MSEISGIGADTPPHESKDEDARAAIGDLDRRVVAISRYLDENLPDRHVHFREAVEQLQGQVPEIDRKILELRQAVINLDGRLVAMQNTQIHNLRISALQLAVQAKATTYIPAQIVECAAAFYNFLADGRGAFASIGETFNQ